MPHCKDTEQLDLSCAAGGVETGATVSLGVLQHVPMLLGTRPHVHQKTRTRLTKGAWIIRAPHWKKPKGAFKAEDIYIATYKEILYSNEKKHAVSRKMWLDFTHVILREARHTRVHTVEAHFYI